MKINIICIFGLFPKEYEREINDYSIRGIQNAANVQQWNFIKSLGSIKEVKIHIINSIYVGSYPNSFKKIRIPSFISKISENISCQNIGFINIPVIKIIDRYRGLKTALDNLMSRLSSNEKIFIIAYAMTSPFVELLRYAKCKYSHAKTILIVPDLPEYMDVSNKNLTYRGIKYFLSNIYRNELRSCDGFILFTKNMKSWFHYNINYIVVEGIVDDAIDFSPEDNKQNIILYSGGIYREYGLLNLVNSFLEINNRNWELHLYGGGEDSVVKEILNLCKVNDKIRYFGCIPRDKIIKYQRNAKILINPRPITGEFIKYSFPSKTLEYMLSGTPLISYKLPGIPEEYYKYFYCVEGNDLAKTISNVTSKSDTELKRMGLSARNFVIENKNHLSQGIIINDFMKQL